MGQSPSALASATGSESETPTTSRLRHSFALGQRRSTPDTDGVRRDSRRSSDRDLSSPQRRSFGSFLTRRTPPSSNSLDDVPSEASGNNAAAENIRLGQPRQPNLDDPPSLLSMEEPNDSSCHLTLEEVKNLSSSDLTVGQSNRDVPAGANRRLQRRQSSDRSLDDFSPPPRHGADHCASPTITYARDEASFHTPEATSRDTYSNEDSYMGQSNAAVTLDASAPDDSMFRYFRRASAGSMASGTSVSDEYSDGDHVRAFNNADFYPQADTQWMGRSIETLLLGYASSAPILTVVEPGGPDPYFMEDGFEEGEFTALRRRSTASTFGGYGRRRSSQGSFPGGRRGSLSLSGGQGHGGTLASYYRRRGPSTPNEFDRQGRRGSTTHVRAFRRRSSMAAGGGSDDGTGATLAATRKKGGPNACLSMMARESSGKSLFLRGTPVTQSLRLVGGHALFNRIDKPAAGIANEVAFLAAAIDSGDWSETQSIVTRLGPRLIGDPMGSNNGAMDPNLPPTAPRFYAGGGRVGLERDAFVLADGVNVLVKVFSEKSFVGQEMALSLDARDLSTEIVATRLAPCWNEALAALRELVFAIPALVSSRSIDDGYFVPFLFTLLSHDSTFDAAAALIEEILAILSQYPQHPAASESGDMAFQPAGRVAEPKTFFLGNVPQLYELWNGFNCRQLAHFCRILALLVFEPEDRQLLESPAVLKSVELLRLRRSRAIRAGRDATVDLNQSILLGDEELMTRLLQLLKVMNYAPGLHNVKPFHVMSQYPFIADTLVILGLGEMDSWIDIDRQDQLARTMQREGEGDIRAPISELGSVATMLVNLGDTLAEPSNQMGSVIQVISAAQQAGVIVSRNSEAADAGEPHSVEDQGTAVARLLGGMIVDSAIQGFASVAGILSEQMLGRRLNSDDDMAARHTIYTPEDAANSLQFNGIILSAYQVEVLFVLCTLLGGRRKLDTQRSARLVIPILEDMFQRLPFSQNHVDRDRTNDDNVREEGVHGAGCDCTPESALCVQFLRLVHNFCDRDVDNYAGRRLLLSPTEIETIFDSHSHQNELLPEPGLLSKLIGAFMRELDESPYRFWLASCIESFLRGSSPDEQLFVVNSGLMKHLLNEITSSKLHCAGSLQTSFDILGELAKGNPHVVKLMMNDLDEDRFHKVFSVATENLIDSNVFIRSLILTVERLAAEHNGDWCILSESSAYLTHSWLDVAALESKEHQRDVWIRHDQSVSSDWFSPQSVPSSSRVGDDFNHSRVGWVFTPLDDENAMLLTSNTVQRLAWFLEKNKATLLRNLMQVVSLQNINHENICCLNTAIVVVMFAHRRRQLQRLLQALRQDPNEDIVSRFAVMNIQEDQLDTLKCFREVLWFWKEYYTHRGRDRLSLEFSSHVRFQEWNHIVSLLTADDGSPTALVSSPICLPRSPYQRAARGVAADEGYLRGA
ncbi:hypothetical protein MPSEU_001060100 [Mayamaea pseudoterrestris]|nr:hypothetical protein MPSEU_001060100 [Mayamaea pseudoterrestris]